MSEKSFHQPLFHPVVQRWFDENFSQATPCQKQAWPAIQRKNNVLVAAPTGSGKTLAAFLTAIDELVRIGITEETLADQVYILYVSPLKALSYDIERNLQAPLQGIREFLAAAGHSDVEIRIGVRTGDTSQSERQKMARKPPHILVTTPESLYLLLTAVSGRNILRSVQRLIVDEIHALADNKRGSHFSLSVARLEWLLGYSPKKTGLSATQKPLERIASFLSGNQSADCFIVDAGHVRQWDLAISLPSCPLQAVLSTESWMELYQKISKLIHEHKTTLIFVNTRRHAERATRYLAEMVGEENVASHHGSLSKEHRRNTERRLKSGKLRAIVATASLELGIDIGDVELVCQLCSPRSIAVFLQRIGRSGHSVGQIPKGRIFPTTRDELVEAAALLKSVGEGSLESLRIAPCSSDVLAQQIVAEASVRECAIDELHARFVSAVPYTNLSKEHFYEILQMLSEGFSLRRGRRGSYLHLDAVNKVIRGRRSARMVAATNAGAIPDMFDYDVILEPEEIRIGTVNEEFAFESLIGDIFQLGNASYRILRVEKGYVRVADAQGLPPNIPFWLGEGRGRSTELSDAVSALREYIADGLERFESDELIEKFQTDYSVDSQASAQIVNYLAMAKKSLGVIPTKKSIVFERFFDETGDAHLVVHSVFGSRLNRAWGLAFRKRFCVRFDFELQAAAMEDSFILSLGPTHSFALDEVQRYVSSLSVDAVLQQAVLGAPMFATRWRWVANVALAVLRFRGGKKVPPPFQRNDSDDLLSLIFPAQLACQENITGPIEIPTHPLVQQTMNDCLHDLMDVTELESLLRRIENREVEITCKDTPEPSLLAHEVLTAKPYAFLDDVPAEERRALAVTARRYTDPAQMGDVRELDSQLIRQLQVQMWPEPRDAEELHDALVNLGFIMEDEADSLSDSASRLAPQGSWSRWFSQLTDSRRATSLKTGNGTCLWVCAERLAEMLQIHPNALLNPKIQPASLNSKKQTEFEQSLISIIRSRMETIGICKSWQIADSLDLPLADIEQALAGLESSGGLMRGHFDPDAEGLQWCDRRFLARVHKNTITQLRSQIKPVQREEFVRFLMTWLKVNHDEMGEGVESLDHVIEKLEGFEAPASVWETELFPSRVVGYIPEMLDYLSASGGIVWCRLSKPEPVLKGEGAGKRRFRFRGSIKSVPLTFLSRRNLSIWLDMTNQSSSADINLSAIALQISESLNDLGPLFFDELIEEVNQLPSHVETALVELFALGLVTCDHFGGIRALLTPERHRRKKSRISRRFNHGVQVSGRWSLLLRRSRSKKDKTVPENPVNYAAQALLKRYGIVFRNLLLNEGRFMPTWGELIREFRRMEDRGEVRGGRFVESVAGEQFALPEAVEHLRSLTNRASQTDQTLIHPSDPINLTGVIYPDRRVASYSSGYLVYKNGEFVNVTDGAKRKRVLPLS